MNQALATSPNPVLTRCMVVESRFQARSEAMRMLRSGNLFHTVFEAHSLTDAISQLKQNDFDTCLIGASVNPERAQDFVSEARRVAKSKDCAFVVFSPSHDQSRNIPGADAVISWPCTRRVLHEQVVQAITKSSTPKARFLKMQAQADLKQPGVRQAVRDAMGTEHLIEHQARRLSGIQRAIRAGRMGLNSIGRPDRVTDHAISRVVDGLITGRVPDRTRMTVRTRLIRTFREWVVYLCLDNQKEANDHLRNCLKEIFDSEAKELR